MIHIGFVEAMRSQPSVLAGIEGRFGARGDEFLAGVARWSPGNTVAVLAMGAAHHSAHALVPVLREHDFRVVNIVASELSPRAVASLADHYLVVTESGRSPEPIEAARYAPAGRRLVITNDRAAPVAEVADAIIDLGGFADSRAYTVGYTATLLAYSAICRALGVIGPGDRSMSDAVAEALEAFGPAARNFGEVLAAAGNVDVIGSGTSYASAAETALLIREGLRIPATAFPTSQYLHGPMEAVNESSVVIVFGDGRERSVPNSLAATGAHSIVIGSHSPDGSPADFVVEQADPFLRSACEVVVAQLLVAAAIEHKPFDIETFLRSQSDTKV